MKFFSLSYITITIAIVAVIGALITLEINDTLTIKTITQVILGLLIALTFFLIERNYELSRKMQDIQHHTNHIHKTISNSIPIEIIIGSENAFKKANTLFHKDCKLDVTNFSRPVLTKNITGKEVEKYITTIEKYSSGKNNFKFRRLSVVKDINKLKWIKEEITKNMNSHNFHMAIKPETDYTPIPNLIIFDEKYSFIFGEHFSAFDAEYLFIESKEIAKYFLAIYNQSWANSIIVQEGTSINRKALEDIEKKLKNES